MSQQDNVARPKAFDGRSVGIYAEMRALKAEAQESIDEIDLIERRLSDDIEYLEEEIDELTWEYDPDRTLIRRKKAELGKLRRLHKKAVGVVKLGLEVRGMAAGLLRYRRERDGRYRLQ